MMKVEVLWAGTLVEEKESAMLTLLGELAMAKCRNARHVNWKVQTHILDPDSRSRPGLLISWLLMMRSDWRPEA